MAAACARTTRPATSAEVERLRAQASDHASFGCLTVLALPVALAGLFVGLRFGGAIGAIGAVVGVLAAAILIAPLLMAFRRHRAPIRARIQQDVADGIIEVLAVTGAAPLAIPATHSSVDPAFAFELDGGRTLVLLGQWLGDPATFGGDAKTLRDDDAGDAFANALPPPYAFPTRAFTVHRFPASGEVVRIDLGGEYVAPAELDGDIDLTKVSDYPSRVFDMPPSGLAGALPRRA